MENNFPDWLRERLKDKGWTNAELARQSGISPAQITRVLNGDRGFGEQSLTAIAKAFNLPAEEVFRIAGTLPPVKNNSRIDRLMYQIEELDEADQEVIERIVGGFIENKRKKNVEKPALS